MKGIDIDRGKRWIGAENWKFKYLTPESPRWTLKHHAVYWAARLSAFLRSRGL